MPTKKSYTQENPFKKHQQSSKIRNSILNCIEMHKMWNNKSAPHRLQYQQIQPVIQQQQQQTQDIVNFNISRNVHHQLYTTFNFAIPDSHPPFVQHPEQVAMSEEDYMMMRIDFERNGRIVPTEDEFQLHDLCCQCDDDCNCPSNQSQRLKARFIIANSAYSPSASQYIVNSSVVSRPNMKIRQISSISYNYFSHKDAANSAGTMASLSRSAAVTPWRIRWVASSAMICVESSVPTAMRPAMMLTRSTSVQAGKSLNRCKIISSTWNLCTIPIRRLNRVFPESDKSQLPSLSFTKTDIT